jgi:hypothetical protein
MCHTNRFEGGQRVTTFLFRGRHGRVWRVDVGIVID